MRVFFLRQWTTMKSGGAKNEKSTIHSLRRLHVQTPQQIGDLQTFANHRYTQQGLRNGALLQRLRRKVVFRCYANNIAFVRACVAPKSTHKKGREIRPFLCVCKLILCVTYKHKYTHSALSLYNYRIAANLHCIASTD